MDAELSRARAVPRLRVISEARDQSPPLIDTVDGADPLAFLRRGQGLVGLGIALRADFSGPTRFTDAASWWSSLCEEAEMGDVVQRPGSGLVAFVTFSFDQDSAQTSTLIVPQRILGRDDQGAFQTTVTLADSDQVSPATPVNSADDNQGGSTVSWSDGQMSRERFIEAVNQATVAIGGGGLHKVVIARDQIGTSNTPINLPRTLKALTESYPDTFVFAIDGFFGASPETLASVRGRTLSLRVLAGSAARGENPEADLAQAEFLATSAKDLDEHHYAVGSVIDSLQSIGIHSAVDEVPFTVKLANLWHLGTDVAAPLPDDLSALHVVDTLHPTAAVAGSPTTAALEFIAETEPFDRGRYAGPVGWIDYRGDGDWAIALRCAQLDATRTKLVAFAGAGIVADSIAERELLETGLKFQPMIQATA